VSILSQQITVIVGSLVSIHSAPINTGFVYLALAATAAAVCSMWCVCARAICRMYIHNRVVAAAGVLHCSRPRYTCLHLERDAADRVRFQLCEYCEYRTYFKYPSVLGDAETQRHELTIIGHDPSSFL
jgi:hypothetical protein